jgi:ribosomal protein S18 acetylase RimI-like enzyme
MPPPIPFLITCATPADAPAILALQKLAYQSEAQLYQDWTIPPLTQTLESLRDEFTDSLILKALADGQLVGSVRAKSTPDGCYIGRLIVHPDFQRRGLGSALLLAVEPHFPTAARFYLFTGSESASNLRLYQRHGYTPTHTQSLSPRITLTYLEKRRPPSPRT